MADAQPARFRERRLALWSLAIFLVIAAFFLVHDPVGPGQVEASASHEADSVAPDREPDVQRHKQPLELAGDGLPIKPSDPDVPAPEGPMHPHPITEAHQRIYRENNLVGALNLAVDLEDPVKLRELAARYRAEFPEDDHRLQEGYEIIADCLDQLDEATVARARHFWKTEIRSQTRRYVRRHCLEHEGARR